MKHLLAFLLILTMVVSLVSCEGMEGLFGDPTGSETSPSTSETTRPNHTRPTTTTSDNGGNGGSDPETDHEYNDFNDTEKETFVELLGTSRIPFIPNDDYNFEVYEFEYDSGEIEIGVNFYTYGNTEEEYENYRKELTQYQLVDSYEDDYGDTWYSYEANNGSHYIDLCYYETEDGYVVDVYIYVLYEDGDVDNGGNNGNGDNGGNSGSTDGDHLYNSFTSSEKSLFNSVVGAVIPFLPNDDYYVEEYSYDYGDEYEIGINFYTFGNTEAEFNAYRALFSNYEFYGTEEDEYGDTWYYYDAPDGSYCVDMVYYYYDGAYVVDVYVYYLSDSNEGGGNDDGNGGSSSDSEYDIMTNEGAGLPTGTNGIFNVNFNDAEYVKNVTDQGYYLDGCPTTGSPAVLVIPVEFKDATAASKGYSTSVLAEAFGKGGETDYYSVYDYYLISSYGQLDLDITVLDYWFRPENNSTYYYNATYEYYGDDVAIGDQLVLDEALAYLEGKMDLSKFDSDNNGIIDAVVLINTLDIGEEDFYWAYRYWNIYTDDEGYYYEYDGVSANDYLWASYQFLYESYDEEGNVNYDDTSVVNTYTFIHEFAHILGLDDYYDTAYVTEPLEGCDMMDAMLGDHNAFSKFNLGWITTSRLVTTTSSVTLTLEDFSKNGDTIIIANNWDEKLGAYQEYYIVVYYTNNGLNAHESAGFFSRDGIVVYHVNASLYSEEYEGETYYDIYNTNTDVSDPYGYGTEDNLIEFVKSGNDTFTYVVGDTLPSVTDDNGNKLGYTFTVDALTSTSATITFTAQ